VSPKADARPDLFLVTGPIQTGKTTRLRRWCDAQRAGGTASSRAGVDGILAPVVNGHRHLFHIGSGAIRDLEDLPVGAPAVTVRRFTFNESVFAWARECLLKAARAAVSQVETGSGAGPQEPGSRGAVTVPWIVVDEAGPFELSGGGL